MSAEELLLQIQAQITDFFNPKSVTEPEIKLSGEIEGPKIRFSIIGTAESYELILSAPEAYV